LFVSLQKTRDRYGILAIKIDLLGQESKSERLVRENYCLNNNTPKIGKKTTFHQALKRHLLVLAPKHSLPFLYVST